MKFKIRLTTCLLRQCLRGARWSLIMMEASNRECYENYAIDVFKCVAAITIIIENTRMVSSSIFIFTLLATLENIPIGKRNGHCRRSRYSSEPTAFALAMWRERKWACWRTSASIAEEEDVSRWEIFTRQEISSFAGQ